MVKIRQISQFLGVHPLVAIVVVALDVMLFSVEAGTLGAGWVVSILAAIVLTIGCVLMQKYGSGDEWGLAIGKGLLIGIITAIPTPLPSFITLGLGAVALLRDNRSQEIEKQSTTLSE